jgi:oxygen-dependent protoporphyrinogen oxidase
MSEDNAQQEPEEGIAIEQADVVVIGGGVAGLIAARSSARGGLKVILIDGSETLGGFVATQTVAGIRVDSGAESFATRGGLLRPNPDAPAATLGPVAQLIQDLGLEDRIESPNVTGAWLQLPDGAAPLPKLTILGIPGAPLATDVRRIIGWGGALRAQLDRYQPLLRVRPETDLGGIVRRRMGRRVLDRLVTPIVAGVHSAHPDLVDVHAVLPGLTTAMTRHGSLSGAVLALIEERGSTAAAGSAVAGLSGGMFTLIEALVADCERYGVEFRLGRAVTALASPGSASDTLAEDGPAPAAPADSPVLTEGAEEPAAQLRWRTTLAPTAESVAGTTETAVLDAAIDSKAVVVATSFRSGLALLADLGIDTGKPSDWPEPASVDLATIVIDDARLDAAPRGTGVLVAPGVAGVRAKALTHATSKWPWLAEAAGAGRHVLRLSYDRAADAGSDVTVTQAEALADAGALLGLTLDEEAVAGFAVTRWDDSLAFATVGHRARVGKLLEQTAERDPSLAVIGAWVAGTGLAATIAQAREATRSLTRTLAP